MLNQFMSLILRPIAALARAITPQKLACEFVRIRLDVSGLDYIVPNEPHAIESARSAIVDDLYQLLKYDEVPASVMVIPAPEASWDDVPSWIAEEEIEEGADD